MTYGRKMIVAVHLIALNGGSVLMSKRKNTGWMDGHWSVPAGHVEKGEDVITTIKREVKEEVDMEIEWENLQFVHVMNRITKNGQRRIDFFFSLFQFNRNVKNLEEDKCEELKWFLTDKLPENTVPYIRAAIKAWRIGIRFSIYKE
jgi:mutator protein MutT